MRKRISQDVAAKAINNASLMNERVISSGKSDSYYIGYYKGVSKVIDASMGSGGRTPWNKRGYPACPIKTPMGLMAARASLLSLPRHSAPFSCASLNTLPRVSSNWPHFQRVS